jgi:hypothetical protein
MEAQMKRWETLKNVINSMDLYMLYSLDVLRKEEDHQYHRA